MVTPLRQPKDGVYRERYGLTADPFSTTPMTAYAWANASMLQTLAIMRGCIDTRAGLGIVDGVAGTGKTTTATFLQDEYAKQGHAAIFLPEIPGLARQTEASVINAVGSALGIPSSTGRNAAKMLEEIERLAVDMSNRGRTTVVIIDDAHALRSNGLSALHTLLKVQTFDEQLVQVILFGEAPEMMRVANKRSAIRSRIGERSQLSPLAEPDVADMIRHRLRVAGRVKPLFDAEAIVGIASLSGGIPRQICRIANSALAEGARRDVDMIDGSLIASIAQRLGGAA